MVATAVDMIITYNDAEITFDAGGDWSPGQAATVSVNDPEANKNPTSAETLSVGDETVSYPNYQDGYWWSDTCRRCTNLQQPGACHKDHLVLGGCVDALCR